MLELQGGSSVRNRQERALTASDLEQRGVEPLKKGHAAAEANHGRGLKVKKVQPRAASRVAGCILGRLRPVESTAHMRPAAGMTRPINPSRKDCQQAGPVREGLHLRHQVMSHVSTASSRSGASLDPGSGSSALLENPRTWILHKASRIDFP